MVFGFLIYLDVIRPDATKGSAFGTGISENTELTDPLIQTHDIN